MLTITVTFFGGNLPLVVKLQFTPPVAAVPGTGFAPGTPAAATSLIVTSEQASTAPAAGVGEVLGAGFVVAVFELLPLLPPPQPASTIGNAASRARPGAVKCNLEDLREPATLASA